jgi:hypothetical protein
MKINELNTFQNMLSNLRQGVGDMAAPTNTQGVGAAAVKARKSGLSTEDQLAQDAFVQKFVSRGANALNTAIQQGLVDVDSTDLGAGNVSDSGADNTSDSGADNTSDSGADNATAQPTTPSAGTTPGAPQAGGTAPQAPGTAAGAPTASGAAGGAGGQPAAPGAAGQVGGTAPAAGTQAAPGTKVKSPGNAAVPTGQKQGAAKPEIDVNVDKIVSAMRKLQPAGTKPLPPTSKIAQEITKDLANVALNKDYLIRVGDKILKLDNAGYDVKNLHQQFMGQYAKGNKQKTISEDRLQEIYKRLTSVERFRNSLRKAGYDPDLVTKRIESLMAKQKKEREDRDRYLKTDEGIMDKVKGFFGGKKAAPAAGATAAPAQGAAPADGGQPAAGAPAAGSGKPSMGAWLRDNFMKGFLRGIDLGSAQQQIDTILKRMPQSLKAKTVNKDLTDIANIAWAVSDQGRKQDTQP